MHVIIVRIPLRKPWNWECQWCHRRSPWRSWAFLGWIQVCWKWRGWRLRQALTDDASALLAFANSRPCILNSSLLPPLALSCQCCFKCHSSYCRFPTGSQRSLRPQSHRFVHFAGLLLIRTAGVHRECKRHSPAFLHRSCWCSSVHAHTPP